MNVRVVKSRVDLNLLTRIIIFTCSAKVCSSNLCVTQDNCSIERHNSGDIFTNINGSCNACSIPNSYITSGCLCQCAWEHTFWSDNNECSKTRTEGCRVRVKDFTLSKAATIENLSTNALQFARMNPNRWVNLNPNWSCSISNQEYLENDGQWRNLNCVTDIDAAFSIKTGDGEIYIQWSGSNDDNVVLDGLLVKLSISCSGGPMQIRDSCLLFKIIGTHTYDPTTPSECEDEDTTTEESKFSTTPRTTVSVSEPVHQYTTSVASSTNRRDPSTLVTSSQPLSIAAATSLATLWTSTPKTDENTVPRTSFLHTGSLTTLKPDSTDSSPMKSRYPTAAIAGGTAAAVIIFIIAGVALFILWRRKFPRNVGKHKNQRVTMSSLQNGHPHPTEGTVDNVIYAGDDAGIVDNVIYEGGMGADGVFSNPGYADKTPQFKPRMDVPGAFVQPNPGATNKTPQPQRNVIMEEPQYAQIVDDQYADPQKVRDRKDKKNKKKADARKDKNYDDLHGPHKQQPGANNSNSNHVYQGLNKGADYQSLRGPREHHEVRPSQVPKTLQDEHDYTSLTHGGSRPSAGTLSKEGPDYTVLKGPDSPGEETATGPDYTTLDGPDSPGDEITSGPDYTVLDGPDSPGD